MAARGGADHRNPTARGTRETFSGCVTSEGGHFFLAKNLFGSRHSLRKRREVVSAPRSPPRSAHSLDVANAHSLPSPEASPEASLGKAGTTAAGALPFSAVRERVSVSENGTDAEPTPAREAPPVDDGLDVDMDLIRRARALRGASQLARTESK